MIISDFHTHTNNSGDSDTGMDMQIQSAINKGIKHLCFTEHLDYDYPLPPKPEYEICSFELDPNSYRIDFINNVQKYSTKNIKLYFGVEIGLMPQIAERNALFVQNNTFDFVIGSTHLLNGDDPYYKEYWDEKDEKEVIHDYFRYTYENICAFSDFDICGHLDYVIRYCNAKDKYFSFSEYSDEIDSILKKIIYEGKGIEINTGGLKNGLNNPNPHPDILKRYKELGGEIVTVGSDAHSPEYIGYRFDTAANILEKLGFKYYAIYKNRKPEFLELS